MTTINGGVVGMDTDVLVRCKFKCAEQMSFVAYDGRILYKVRFLPVTSGSEENKAFYDATPGGELKIETISVMPFELGGEYYLDIIPARVAGGSGGSGLISTRGG